MRTWLIAPLVCAACTGAALAAGPTIYRCGPDGREFSQFPCKDGRVVDAADPRTAEQQRDAQAVADSQARLARQLEAERRQREAAATATAAATPKRAAAVKAPPPQTSTSDVQDWTRNRKKAPREGREPDFVARVPATPAGSKP